MRKLTILRKKTFVGCAAKMKVYIEDPWKPELTIAGVGCRKLGEIKNGESATYEVSDASVRVFVIADKLSRDMCNDFYTLPAGEEDVSLSGQCRYNPAVGNAFRFDGNASADVVENRKKGLRKGLIILVIVLVVGFVGGFVWGVIENISEAQQYEEAAAKEFTYRNMRMTLDENFAKVDDENYDAYYKSDKAIVAVLWESFQLYPTLSSYSQMGYAKLVCEANNLDPDDIQQKDGLVFIETNDGRTHSWLFFFRSSSACYTIQIAVNRLSEDTMEPYVFEWAKSVKFLY